MVVKRHWQQEFQVKSIYFTSQEILYGSASMKETRAVISISIIDIRKAKYIFKRMNDDEQRRENDKIFDDSS